MTELTLELIDQTFKTSEAIVKLTEKYDGGMCNLNIFDSIFDSYLNSDESYYIREHEISKADHRKRRKLNRKFKTKDRGNIPFYSHKYRVDSKMSKTNAQPSERNIISDGFVQYMYDSLPLAEY